MIIRDAATITGGGHNGEFPTTLGLDGEGRIVVALTCAFDLCAYRFTADGEPDLAFGASGLATVDVDARDELFGATVRADGGVLLAGAAGPQGGARQAVIAQLTATGSRDLGFGAAGVVALDPGVASDATARVVGIDARGAILVGGGAHAGDREQLTIARLSASGVREAGFGGTYALHGGGATARALVFDPAGRAHLLARAGEHAVVTRLEPGAAWALAPLPDVTTLPIAGPTPSTPALTYATATTLPATLASAPLETTGAPAVFIHAQAVTFLAGGQIAADGGVGPVPQVNLPGAGGGGASGGGAGAYGYSGVAGFDGRFGRDGTSIGGVAGGTGHASAYARGFYYGRGGDGGRGESCCPSALPAARPATAAVARPPTTRPAAAAAVVA